MNRSILKPASFFENFDDASVYNPLCKGYLRDLFEGWIRVAHVATLDIGKAAVAMASNPKKWHAKTLTCITSVDTGEDLAKTLSSVSSMPVVYQAAPPRLILRFLLSNLWHMVDYCRKTGHHIDWSKEMSEFKAVVPDALDFETWLSSKTWSDGTTIVSSGLQTEPKNQVPYAKLFVLGIAVAAACYGVIIQNRV